MSVDQYLTRESVAKIREWIAEALAADPPRDGFFGEVEYRHRDGRRIPIEIHATFHRDASGRVVEIEGVSRDVSPRKQAERQRARFEEQLQRAQRLESIGQLAGGIAHDFNNLLMGILGGASILKKKLADQPDLYRTADIVEGSAQRASTLTGQLLAFARGGKYQPLPLNLDEAVTEAVDMLPTVTKHHVRIRQRANRSLDPVEGDRAQIVQIIVNLCQNAIEAIGRTRLGRPGVAARRPVVACRRRSAVATKRTTSCRSATRDRASRRTCASGSSSRSSRRASTAAGSGWAAVYGIVANHDGAVTVDDGPDGGSIFRVFLPVHAGPIRAAGAGGGEKGTTRTGATILVVDDEEVPRESSVSILESLGHNVLKLADTTRALDMFRRNRDSIDLVLIGPRITSTVGTPVVRAILDLDPRARVLLSSEQPDALDLPHELRNRIAGVVRKPFTVHELSAVVNRTLAHGYEPSVET